MNVVLAPELESLIREKAETGSYANASEVVHEALRLMHERARLRELRASLVLVEPQIDRGEFVEWTPELMERPRGEADGMARQGLRRCSFRP